MSVLSSKSPSGAAAQAAALVARVKAAALAVNTPMPKNTVARSVMFSCSGPSNPVRP
ncbi:hypothetical protein [Streptodolium elevatio]